MKLGRVLAWLVAIAVLAAVFLAYRQPDTVVDFATRLWSCF